MKRFQNRSLDGRYIAIFLDALFFYLRRDTLDEEIRKVYPRADFQLCTIHASRNFESEIREYDVDIIDSQLKQIFLSEDREEVINRFNEFKSIWEGKYPKQAYNLERKLNCLFTYFQYPKPIRRSIHSNIIEIMNKEIRRRIKTIDSLPTEESAMKIIYLRMAKLNEKWSHRVINGYFKCKDELMEIFSKRYP